MGIISVIRKTGFLCLFSKCPGGSGGPKVQRSKGRYGGGPEGDPGGPWGFSWGGPREGPGGLGGPGNF